MDTATPHLDPEVVDALTGLDVAVQALTKITTPAGGRLGTQPLMIVEFIRRFEALRNQLGQVDQHIITVCEAEHVAHELTQRNTATLLATTLRISAGEAGRRVRAAAALAPRTGLLGIPLEPARPVLAAAVATGTLSADNTDIVVRCLDTLNRIPSITPEALDRAEHDLTVHAGVLRPEDLRAAATKIIECYDPDGQAERDRKTEALRELRLVSHRDGSYSIAGRLTGVVGAQLYRLLTPLAKPRPAEPTPQHDAGTDADADADSPTARRDRLQRAKAAGTHDERTFGQRWHDALADLINRFARTAQTADAEGLPATGGTPATVIVTINAEEPARPAPGTAPPPTEPPSPPPRCSDWPMRHSSCRPCSPDPVRSSAKAGTAASPPEPRPWPWWPGTAGAPSPGATTHPNGANATTSEPGSTADSPT